jgi:CheY-like chemotaxis protein
MSHEIRTPLNAILGFATILERDPSISPKQKDACRTISRSGKHLLEIINDILNMSKIEAGKLSLHTAPFSPLQLLEDLVSVFQSQAASKGVAFQMHRESSLPKRVLGDEAKIRQICVNLLGNAVKFTQKGSITLKVHTEEDKRKENLREDIREDTQEDAQEERSLYLVVEVKDTGPGISSEELPRIFEAFRQAEGGEHAGGTGLGLSITKSLVQFMGGTITAESTLGEGSSFRFRIPLKESASKKEELPHMSQLMAKLQRNREPVRILVVDDSRDNREFLRALLEPQGFLLMEGTNGIEALEMLEFWKPHLILMDIQMPIMDGCEAILKIRENPAHEDLPIIAVTARSFEEDAQAIRLAGTTDYLSKPFTPESLFVLLEKYLHLEDALHQEQRDFSSREGERSLSREDLAGLPKDLLSSMKQAVHEGDMGTLEELVREVQQIDSLWGAELQELVEQYDYEKLQFLLE